MLNRCGAFFGDTRRSPREETEPFFGGYAARTDEVPGGFSCGGGLLRECSFLCPFPKIFAGFVSMTFFHKSFLYGTGADDGSEHALNDEFLSRNEIGKAGIFGFQKMGHAVGDEAFESDFAVNKSSDDVAMAGRRFLHDCQIPVNNVCINHGVTTHSETEDLRGRREPERLRVNIEKLAFALITRGIWVTGRHDAEHRDAGRSRRVRQNHRAGTASSAGEGTLTFQGHDVPVRGEGTCETKVRLDFAQRRRAALGAPNLRNESENGGLFLSQLHE